MGRTEVHGYQQQGDLILGNIGSGAGEGFPAVKMKLSIVPFQ